MTDLTITTVEDKIQNACFQLNHDAYVLQSKNKKHLRQFTPCQKSLVLLDCLREGTHFGTAMMTASLTWCPCHNGLSEDGLYNLCFDRTARDKHYGDIGRMDNPPIYATELDPDCEISDTDPGL